MVDIYSLPFVQAKWYTRVADDAPRGVRLVVLHDMEAPDKPGTARGVARYFADGSGGRQASAHYCVDNTEIIQCVQTRDVAYGAMGVNRHGVHIENAGYASQSVTVWNDEYNTAMLKLSAGLAAELCKKFDITPEFLDYGALLEMAAKGWPVELSGITTHAQASLAFHPGGHTDPGPNFPIAQYIAWVKEGVPT